MQIKFFLLCLLTGCMITVSAQETTQGQPAKKGCSCSFVPILQMGTLMGEKGTYGQLQIINGIRYKTWYAGIGAGVDWYGIRGLPIFLDLRKDIFKTPNSPFFYADGGIHLPHVNDNENEQWYTYQYSNGFYSDVGFGLRVGITRRSKILVSGGYSYKDVIKHQTWKCGDGVPCLLNTFTYTSHLHRMTLKMGWQF